MCGRFTITSDRVEIILERFRAELAPGYGRYDPRYNAAPGQYVPVIVMKEGRRYLTNMLWGFVPPWGEKAGPQARSQANIRDDTISRNSFFREKLLTNRCIFVADGFYEWKKPEGYEGMARGERLPKGIRKTPYRIIMKNGEMFGIAGLWRPVGPEKEKIVTAGIITTDANEFLKHVHDRMPVILEEEKLDCWLDPGIRIFDQIYPLLEPYPEDKMEAYVVTDLVNNSRQDLPACILKA